MSTLYQTFLYVMASKYCKSRLPETKGKGLCGWNGEEDCGPAGVVTEAQCSSKRMAGE